MSYPIAEIEGIGAAFEAKLREAGVTSTSALLERAGSKKGRGELAAATGIDESKILSWANLADLMRVKGVGKQFSELLHAAGVDTIKELRTRNPANLAAAVTAANEKTRVAATVPAESQLAAMINAAKELEPIVTH